MVGSHQSNIFQFSTHVSRRGTKSSPAGEVIVFSDAFHNAFRKEHGIQREVRKPILWIMRTDSKLSFDVTTGSQYINSLRQTVDIAAAEDAYNQFIISNLAPVNRKCNIAEVLAKILHCLSLEKFIVAE